MFHLFLKFLFFSYLNFLLRTRTSTQFLAYHDWYAYHGLRNHRHIKVRHDHFLRRHIQFKHFAIRLYVLREAALLKSVKREINKMSPIILGYISCEVETAVLNKLIY
jgi:hypothetical protein